LKVFRLIPKNIFLVSIYNTLRLIRNFFIPIKSSGISMRYFGSEKEDLGI
jgi:hypothetical protein